MKRRIYKKLLALFLIAVLILENICAGKVIQATSGNQEVQAAASEEEADFSAAVFSVSGGSGTLFYKGADEDADAYCKVTLKELELAPGEYDVKYVAPEGYLLGVSLNGCDMAPAFDYAATGETWQQQWETRITFYAGETQTLKLEETELFVDIADEIVPEFPYAVSVKGSMASNEEWQALVTQSFQFSADVAEGADSVICESQNGSWNVEYKKTSDAAPSDITVTASFDDGKIVLKKQVSVTENAEVVYGTDFSVGNTEQMYAEIADDILTIYHNGKAGAVYIFKKNYTAYRYRFDEEAYPDDFTVFQEEEKQSVDLRGSKMYLQMKNTDASSPKFGSSGTVCIVEDTTAPQIDTSSVIVKQGFSVQSPYQALYSPQVFNAQEGTCPLLDFDVKEENLLKVEIAFGDGENVVTLAPSAAVDGVYTYENVSLGEASAFAAGSLTITVYDKAMNTDVYTYSTDGNIREFTYVKSPTVLEAPTVVNDMITNGEKSFVVISQGTIDMQLHITSELFLPALLELKLMQINADGSRTEVADVRDGSMQTFTVTGGDGKWDVNFCYDVSETEDVQYVIEAYYTDIAQSDSMTNQIISCESAPFYLDVTPITLCAVSEEAEYGGIANTPVRVVYTMTDANPDFEQIRYEYSSKINSADRHNVDVTIVMPDGSLECVSISEVAAWVNSASVWKQDGMTYTLTLVYTQESMYRTSLTVMDIMHTQAAADYQFEIDLSAPEIYSVDVISEYVNGNHTDYRYFDSSSVEISVTVIEEIAQAPDMEICCITLDADTGIECQIPLEFQTQEKNLFAYYFTIQRNFKGSITFSTKDAKNEDVAFQADVENGIIVEGEDMHRQTSGCSISETTLANANGFYHSDILLKLEAWDSYSGIRALEYNINGEKTTVHFQKKKTITTVWEQTPVLKAESANEGNDIRVALTMIDNAGHTSIVDKTFKIDATKPDISVSYDNHSTVNKTYYNRSRTATITIRELNFDSENTVVTVYRNGVSHIINTSFHTDGNLRIGEDGKEYKEYVLCLPFTEDGDYTFTVETKDLAGNNAVYEQTEAFTIDQTMPEITITYDAQTPYTEQYYAEARVATVTVIEHNFTPACITCDVKAAADGSEDSVDALGEFTSVGDVHTARLTFAEDAKYQLTVTVCDLAGNENQLPKQCFIVDMTPPEITITGVSENASYNKMVLPKVTVTDRNYDTQGVHVEIVGLKNGIMDMSPKICGVSHGQSYSFSDLEYSECYDDCYVLRVTATDKAGHQTTSDINYRVNRFGSSYAPNDALAQVIARCYGCASDDYAIIVTNVDRVEQYQLSYMLDGEIINLKEGIDYEVHSMEAENMWKRYEYQLRSSIFQREGVYSISVSTEDAAGNVTDNKSKNTVLKFCIDHTAPSCIISGVSDGQRFAKDDEISIDVEVYDNMKLSQVSVCVNGRKLYTEADFMDESILHVDVDRSIQNQEIIVEGVDEAGNQSVETVRFRCLTGKSFLAAWICFAACMLGVFLFLKLTFFKRIRKLDGHDKNIYNGKAK